MLQVILLAAGLSKRFGETNKLLHTVDGAPMFMHTLSKLDSTNLGEVILVTGLDREAIIAQIPSSIQCREVYNPNFTEGMTSSIKVGVKACAEATSAYMICLADQIQIQTQTYTMIANNFKLLSKNYNRAIQVPSYQKQKGNPVVISNFYRNDILDLKTTDGCKSIVTSNKESVNRLEVDDPGILYDIDILEDLG